MHDRLRWTLLAALFAFGCAEEPEPHLEAPEALEETPEAEAPAAAAAAPQLAPGEQLVPGSLVGTVRETMDAAGYTYLRVEEGERSHWVAALQMDVEVGDRVEIAGGSAIRDFRSRTLDRTFDQIIFAGRARVLGENDAPMAPGQAPTPTALPPGHPPLGADGSRMLGEGHPSTGAPPPSVASPHGGAVHGG